MLAFITFGVIVLSFVLAAVFKHKFIAKKICLLGRHVIVTQNGFAFSPGVLIFLFF